MNAQETILEKIQRLKDPEIGLVNGKSSSQSHAAIEGFLQRKHQRERYSVLDRHHISTFEKLWRLRIFLAGVHIMSRSLFSRDLVLLASEADDARVGNGDQHRQWREGLLLGRG